MNLFSHNSLCILETSILRDCFGVFGGHKTALQHMNEVFGNNRVIALIGLQHDVEWPPRSPDLTPCDFLVWGYLKDKVFSTPPQNIDVLRQRIIDEFKVQVTRKIKFVLKDRFSLYMM